MSEQEVLAIIRTEKLARVNWFDEDNVRDNQVGIKRSIEGWEVYITDERASIIAGTECQFANVHDAYDALIRKARYVQRLFG